jgi:hypothetical protein
MALAHHIPGSLAEVADYSLSLYLSIHRVLTLPASCFKMNDATFAASYFRHAVSGSFNPPLGVLCNFPSRY